MLDRRTGDLLFVQCAAAGKPLDDQAVVIAAGKAHPLVDAGRILPQDMLHRTFALHEFFPVQHCQLAQTENAMLHREFVSRLLPDVVQRPPQAASFRSRCGGATRIATRQRFSIRPSRNMPQTDHSSASFSGATVW